MAFITCVAGDIKVRGLVGFRFSIVSESDFKIGQASTQLISTRYSSLKELCQGISIFLIMEAG